MVYNRLMNCNCNRKPCKHCDTSCGCPAPFLGITQLPDNISVLRFNIDGKQTDYDFANLIYQNQSDTSLHADAINRVLTYMAERHMDSISAQELGAIFHLADMGDVTTKGAEDGSMLVYQKGTNCGEGCTGVGSVWKVWSALDEQVSSASYLMAANNSGVPVTLQRPAQPSQYYQLGWNAANQLSFSQIPVVSTAPVGTDNKKLAVYVDPRSQQLVAVKE